MSEPKYAFTIPAPAPAVPPRRRWNAALWLIGVGLIANAAVLLVRGQAPDIVLDRAAFAQAAPTPGNVMLGARGIYMMPAQLSPSAFGVYLLDVDAGTICVYSVNPDGPRLHFMAARSYKNDRFQDDYNNDHPTPKEVQALVEQQRKRTELKDKDNEPTVDQNPKPDENKPDMPKDAPQ